jgi:hypothetical protein
MGLDDVSEARSIFFYKVVFPWSLQFDTGVPSNKVNSSCNDIDTYIVTVV